VNIVILHSNELSEIEITNHRKQTFRIGDYAYYNIITPNLQISTQRVIIRSFVLFNNKVCICYAVNNQTSLINVEDIYDTFEEATEVADKWIQRMLKNELVNEIKLSLGKQKNVPLSIQELSQS
jgi:hypothetical protein